MNKSVGKLLKEWQTALQAEISHLKNYGSNKLLIINGRLLSNDQYYTYYFDTPHSIKVPIGSNVKVKWGSMLINGRVLSSEGKNMIISLDQNIGDFLSELYLYQDPWELLEQLIERLDEIKKTKKKRAMITRLMNPDLAPKHPNENIKSTVHELMLRSQYNPVTFVWGPPGTGKTYTLARVASNKYINGKKVLVLAHSNQAVDILMDEISSFLFKKSRFKEGDIIRYGSQSNPLIQNSAITTQELLRTFYPDLALSKEQLIEKRRLIKLDLSSSFSKRDSETLLELETKIAQVTEKIRQKEVEFIEHAFIVGTTLAKAAGDAGIYEKEYDIVIVDEVSQAYVPQIAFAASLGKRLIVSGDFKQLPPIAIGHHPLIDEWLREDIFHKSGVTSTIKDGTLHPHLLLLKEQRRMHPDISAFTNKFIYHSLVTDHPSVFQSRLETVNRSPFPQRASILLDLSYSGEHCINERSSNSRINLWSLLISFQLIYESYESGVRSLGYITPYRAQAHLMDSLLDEIFVREKIQADISSATVHRFQGSEREIILFDTVDGYPQNRPGMLLIKEESERLINVAITRTKGKFIHITDSSFIQQRMGKGKTLRNLVDYQLERGQGIFPKDIGKWIINQHPNLKWIHARKTEHVIDDLVSAKDSIMISLPNTSQIDKEWITAFKLRRKGVTLTLISEGKTEALGADYQIFSSLPFPFFLIDQKILWLGVPVEAANRIQPPYVAARLVSEAIGAYVYAQLPID
jgi:superfamily I DNA and/or RNA helicase